MGIEILTGKRPTLGIGEVRALEGCTPVRLSGDSYIGLAACHLVIDLDAYIPNVSGLWQYEDLASSIVLMVHSSCKVQVSETCQDPHYQIVLRMIAVAFPRTRYRRSERECSCGSVSKLQSSTPVGRKDMVKGPRQKWSIKKCRQ